MNNQLRTVVLFGGLSLLLIGIGWALGPRMVLPFTVLAVLMNLGGYFFSDKLVLRMHGAREINRSQAPELFSAVEELAQRAELPMPKVYIIPSGEANAFATGRDPQHGAVAFTEGILRLLSERELRGVIAHELSHIKNRDILIATAAAIAAAAISNLANMLQFQALFGGHRSSDDQHSGSGAAQLLVMLVAPLAATLIQLGISRSREYLADETGAQICGDPEGLASALERLQLLASGAATQFSPATSSLYIVNPFAGLGGMAHLFSTHPPAAERIRRLLAMGRRAAAA